MRGRSPLPTGGVLALLLVAAPASAQEIPAGPPGRAARLEIRIPSTMLAAGLGHLVGAHCTGFGAVYRLRELAGLSRASAVGAGFSLEDGIEPPALAR